MIVVVCRKPKACLVGVLSPLSPGVNVAYSHICTSSVQRSRICAMEASNDVLSSTSCSSGVWSVHECDFSGNLAPFKLSLHGCAGIALLLKDFLPHEKLIGKAQVRLYNDIEPTSSHKAIGARERHVQSTHDLGNANRGAPGNTNAAMHQSRNAPASSSICKSFQSATRQISSSDAC